MHVDRQDNDNAEPEALRGTSKQKKVLKMKLAEKARKVNMANLRKSKASYQQDTRAHGAALPPSPPQDKQYKKWQNLLVCTPATQRQVCDGRAAECADYWYSN